MSEAQIAYLQNKLVNQALMTWLKNNANSDTVISDGHDKSDMNYSRVL